MMKETKDSLNKQNIVVASMRNYYDYKRRSIIYYVVLFGGMVFLDIVGYVLMTIYSNSWFFLFAHTGIVMYAVFVLIAWVTLDIYRPVPIPHEEGSAPKKIAVYFVFGINLVVAFFVSFWLAKEYKQFYGLHELGCASMVICIFMFFLAWLVSFFSEFCDITRGYAKYREIDRKQESDDLLNMIVTNPAFKDFSCNVWHEDENNTSHRDDDRD